MLHFLRVVHDEFGNPSVDELIPAALACILLAGVLIMVAMDTLKSWRHKQVVSSSDTDDVAEVNHHHLD